MYRTQLNRTSTVVSCSRVNHNRRVSHTCFVRFIVHHQDNLIFDQSILLMIDGPDSIAHLQIFDATLFTVDETDQILAIETRRSYKRMGTSKRKSKAQHHTTCQVPRMNQSSESDGDDPGVTMLLTGLALSSTVSRWTVAVVGTITCSTILTCRWTIVCQKTNDKHL